MRTGDDLIVLGSGVEPARPVVRSVLRGARGTCPACGRGALFSRLLTTVPACPACGEELHHHRADDLPAYLNILVTGHVVVGTMMVAMTFELLPLWTLTALTVALAVTAAFALMRPLKGMVVAAQWALGMHGFGGHDD
ncbi:MAG: hypothetical protein BroJett030_29800 [Alphaproteobacteria bacterium]|nr:MAG: hypothetical protein BroJett030_29800 [Alphaproteobacteria bacterium]